MASYVPKCFVDIDKSKDGREIQGLPVLSENEATFQKLKKYGIQEIIFALPSMADERRTERYLYYKNAGWRIVALLFIVVPIIICIIISFIITYFPTSDVSLILASDFLPIAIKIQGVGILIAILVSIFKIKKD